MCIDYVSNLFGLIAPNAEQISTVLQRYVLIFLCNLLQLPSIFIERRAIVTLPQRPLITGALSVTSALGGAL